MTRDELPLEFMMNALRLTDGFPTHLFPDRTGLPLKSTEKELLLAEDRGLIDWRIDMLKPSLKGQRYLNELLELLMR